MDVDTTPPAIDMTEQAALGDPVYFEIADGGSGLSMLRIVIQDDAERFKKVVWVESLSGKKHTDEILWDGKFKDGTKAPAGTYFITTIVTDLANNESRKTALVTVDFLSYLKDIPPFNPPTDPLTLNQPSTDQTTPSTTDTSVDVTGFGGTVISRSENTYTKTSFLTPSTTKPLTPTDNRNIFVGAAAAAMLYTTLAEWQKRREEEAARQAAAEAAKAEGDRAAFAAKMENEGKKNDNRILSYKERAKAYQASLDNFNAYVKKAEEVGVSATEIAALKANVVNTGTIGASLEKARTDIVDKIVEREIAYAEFRRGELEHNHAQQQATPDVINIPELVTYPIETIPLWKFWDPSWNVKDAWNGLVSSVLHLENASTVPPAVIKNPNSTFLILPPEKIDLTSDLNPFGLNVPIVTPRIIPAGTVLPTGKKGDGLHGTLDAIGLVPATGIGEVADLVNALIYFSEGRNTEAGISIASVLVFGDLLKIGKLTVKVGAETLELTTEAVLKTTLKTTTESAARQALENVTVLTLERVTKEALEKAAKEAAEKAVERAAKQAAQAALDKIAKEIGEQAITKDIAKSVTDRALKEFAETSADQVAREVAEKKTKELVEKLAQYPVGSPLRLTPAELIDNKEAQQALYDMAKGMRNEQQTFAKELLEELNISGEFESILKRDTLEEFVEGVVKKSERNGYAFVGQMDDMTRGRFDLKSWDDVESLENALKNQSDFKITAYEDVRRLQDNGGYGYPRYHIVLEDPKTLVTHEWQVGTNTTTKLFETPGIRIPEAMQPTMPKGMKPNLHDIEFDIFRQGIDRKYPDISQKYGIPEFLKKVDQYASETGIKAERVANLEQMLAETHAGASEILEKLVAGEPIDFIAQFYH